jgi:hypothetical protein
MQVFAVGRREKDVGDLSFRDGDVGGLLNREGKKMSLFWKVARRNPNTIKISGMVSSSRSIRFAKETPFEDVLCHGLRASRPTGYFFPLLISFEFFGGIGPRMQSKESTWSLSSNTGRKVKVRSNA